MSFVGQGRRTALRRATKARGRNLYPVSRSIGNWSRVACRDDGGVLVYCLLYSTDAICPLVERSFASSTPPLSS